VGAPAFAGAGESAFARVGEFYFSFF